MTAAYSPVLVQEVLAAIAWSRLPADAGIEACLLRMADILRDKVERAELYRRVERIAELEAELRLLRSGARMDR